MTPFRHGSLLGVLVLLLLPCPALPCSLCGLTARRTSLTQEYERARVVVLGTLMKSTLNTAPGGVPGSGSTEVRVDRVLKSEPGWRVPKEFVLPSYLPVLDPKNPPRFLFVMQPVKGRLEPGLGRQIHSGAVLDYLRQLPAKDRTARLLYAARFFDHADSTVAEEAFLEFAKASDAEVMQAARRLDAARLRKLIAQPGLDAERLSLFAYLLGACGGAKDAALLRGLFEKSDPQSAKALEGILAGYIALQPEAGWKLTHGILGDPKQAFLRRFAAVRTLRFFHNARPAESRAPVLAGLRLMVPQGDLADMAINDLRALKLWELTPLVLEQYGKKSHDAPIVRNCLLRYALVCPRPEARALVESVRRRDPALIRDLEEDLLIERGQ